MMTDRAHVHSHSYGYRHPPTVGICTWEHTSWGVILDCTSPVFPGMPMCEQHMLTLVALFAAALAERATP